MDKLRRKVLDRKKVLSIETRAKIRTNAIVILVMAAPYAAVLLGKAQNILAADQLIVSTDIRVRYELMNNFNQRFYGNKPALGKGNDGFFLGRFRLGLEYRPSPNIHFAVGMQHSEVWDSEFPDRGFFNSTFGMEHNPNRDRWELYNTFVEIKKLFTLPLSLKIGRQVVAYGNNRVFGPGQWGNTGRWVWDAAKLSYKFDTGFVDVFYGRTQIHEPNRFSLNHRHGFEGAECYSHFELGKKPLGILLEPFFMLKADGHRRYEGEDGSKGNLNSYYVGIRSYRNNLKGFNYDSTFLTQWGDIAHDDIRAYAYHALIGYAFLESFLRPGIEIEYSYASGDADPYDGDHETFDAAFGARDRMYGRMNLFKWMNLQDAQINFDVRHWRIHIRVEYHQFLLAENKDAWYLNAKAYRDKTGRSGNRVGKELDIIAKVTFPKGHEVQLGYGHFWPDEFAKSTASRKEANWVFLQWSYQFLSNLPMIQKHNESAVK